MVDIPDNPTRYQIEMAIKNLDREEANYLREHDRVQAEIVKELATAKSSFMEQIALARAEWEKALQALNEG